MGKEFSRSADKQLLRRELSLKGVEWTEEVFGLYDSWTHLAQF